MNARRDRLVAAGSTGNVEPPDAGAIFDPVTVNRHRGPFDLYLKAWPIMAILVVVVGAVTYHPSQTSGSGGTSVPPVSTPLGYPTAGPPTDPPGTAHLCYSVAGQLAGCQAADGTMLFGNRQGSLVTCWFFEPITPSESVPCR
jgi:hypothetical protein